MKILLGITGGIAAYKSCHLVRELVKQGHDVRVILTKSAKEFVTPLTLQTLSQNRVAEELFDLSFESEIGHIELARWADVVVVAPATANFVGKAAHGLADDLLSTVVLATTAPVVYCPAMNTVMWESVVVQENLEVLRGRGGHVVLPDCGTLACREVGVGRMPDFQVIFDAIVDATTPKTLKNKRILVTAGPTREWIDAARFLSNPSSGKMGFAIAQAAAARGAQVTLVTGPVDLPTPAYKNLRRIDVESAQQMHDAVFSAVDCGESEYVGLNSESEYGDVGWPSLDEEVGEGRESGVDVVIMAAAVADLRPMVHQEELLDAQVEVVAMQDLVEMEASQAYIDGEPRHAKKEIPTQKLPKSKIFGQLEFSRNPDILQELGACYPVGSLPLIVGFAAQSDDVELAAEAKRCRKKAHLMIANKIGGEESAFGEDQSRVCLLLDPTFHDIDTLQSPLWTPRQPKAQLADEILQWVERVLQFIETGR